MIGALIHASRLGLFDMSWNVLCPECAGVLGAGAALKTLNQKHFYCAFCGVDYEPTLDAIVEVTFTVNPRVRHIAAHDPETLPNTEYLGRFSGVPGSTCRTTSMTPSTRSSLTPSNSRQARRRRCR